MRCYTIEMAHFESARCTSLSKEEEKKEKFAPGGRNINRPKEWNSLVHQ